MGSPVCRRFIRPHPPWGGGWLVRSIPDSVIEWPDIVLYDGKVVTVDADFSIVEAVAIRDGRFLASGSTDSIRELTGPDTVELDLEGRTVIPGLVDSHIHLDRVGIALDRIELFDARSLDDVIESIQAAAETAAGDSWLLAASSWHESQLTEGRLPRVEELDRAAPETPVFVPRGMHVAVLNSAAMERIGIDEDTPNPEGGTIVRDADGDITGVVLETARTQLVEPHLPDRSYHDTLADLERGMAELNRRGVTAIGIPGLYRDSIRALEALVTEGSATLRSSVLVKVDEASDVTDAAAYFAPGFGNERLRVDGLKYFLDGGVEGAALRDPYEVVEGVQEDPDYHGHLTLPPGGKAEFEEILALAAERGYQMHTHAVGDATIEYLMEAYSRAHETSPIDDLRWAVVHAFLPPEESFETMRELDLISTVQNHPTYLGANMERWWGEERARYAIPIRDILDEGIPTGGGTDAPVVPWRPFESLWWMVTRDTITAGVLGPEQAVSIEEALRLWTIGSAYAVNWEAEIGSIEPSKRADLTILDTDLLTCPSDDIREVSVERTMVGGETVYEA